VAKAHIQTALLFEQNEPLIIIFWRLKIVELLHFAMAISVVKLPTFSAYREIINVSFYF